MCWCVYVCLSVCVSAPKGINNQWHDMVCLRLVKQVPRLFPVFIYFIWYLPSIKWMGVAILTQHTMNTCQRKLRWHGTIYKRTTGRRSASFIKVSWQMCSNSWSFKRRPPFSFTVTDLKLLSTAFITMVLEYKAVLKLQKQLVCVSTHFLVMSPCSCDFLWRPCIFNYNGYYSSLTYERSYKCLVFR